MKTAKNGFSFVKTDPSSLAFLILLFIFICSATFFAVKLKPGIIPDEEHHFEVSKFFSRTLGIPPDTAETIPYGVIKQWPFLFYWINGRVLNLANWIAPTLSNTTLLIILRFFSVIFSTITVIYGYLFAKELINNRWGPIFVVFLLTNTLMFVFLAGGANYDNLTNLCSFAGIYYLTLAFQGKSFYKNSSIWLICMSVGSLIKITMLPLALVTGMVWLIYIARNRHSIEFKFVRDIKSIGIALTLIALFAANLAIYGVNLIRYRTLVPQCLQVFSEKECTSYPQFVQNRGWELEKKISPKDIMIGGYPDPIEYVSDSWITLMMQRIYGILGHIIYYPDISITVHRLLLFWAIAVAIRYWEKPSSMIANSCAIFLGFTVILILDNFNTELFYGFKHVGLQGRYIFPVIGIYYTLMVYSFLKIRVSFLRSLTFAIATNLFLLSSAGAFVLILIFSSSYSYWFR